MNEEVILFYSFHIIFALFSQSSEGISKSPLKRAIIQMRTFNARRKIQSAINIAANSSLWDKMAAVTHSHKFKRIPTSMSTVPPVLDPLETKTMNKAVNDVITMIQDSVEEAHILHEVPQYVFNTSVVHDPKLTTLLKVSASVRMYSSKIN